MISRDAQNLSEILSHVKAIAKEWLSTPTAEQELWFRGQPKADQKLYPTMYRPDYAIYHYDEDSLLERFKVLAAAHVDARIFTEWDWYFLARHHSLPSRLLDWTGNLLTAVYFSIAEHFSCDRRDFDKKLRLPIQEVIYSGESPAIWILEPGSLNKISCGEDLVITPGGPISNLYLPPLINSQVQQNQLPLAILPPQSNFRIVAQQARFTLHGTDTHAIDDLIQEDQHLEIKLAMIRVDQANLAHLWNELDIVGINRMSMFPDLDSIAHCVIWDSQNISE